MSRPKSRRVIVKLVNRNPRDSIHLLKAIEEVFRPKHLRIVCEDVPQTAPDDSPRSSVPDEQLETAVNREVAQALDARVPPGPTPPSYPPPEPSPSAVASARAKTIAWARAAVAKGYTLTVKAVAEAVLNHYDPKR